MQILEKITLLNELSRNIVSGNLGLDESFVNLKNDKK